MAGTESPLRVSRLIWWTRLIQLLFVLIVLGVSGSWSAKWMALGCATPINSAFNVAVATLAFVTLLFLIPTTGPLSKTRFWNSWVQLALDGLFIILWIAAAAASHESCSDLCGACSSAYPSYVTAWRVWWDQEGLLCQCFRDGGAEEITLQYAKRQSPATPLVRRGGSLTWKGSSGEGSAAVGNLEKAGEMAVKQGFDAAIVLLFALTSIYGLFMIFRKPNPASGNVEMTGEEHEATTKMGETVTESEVPESR